MSFLTRVNWIYVIIISSFLKNVITIRLFGNMPLQFFVSHKNATEYVWTQPGSSCRRIRRRILHLPVTDTRAPHVIFLFLISLRFSLSIPTRPRRALPAAAAAGLRASRRAAVVTPRAAARRAAGLPRRQAPPPPWIRQARSHPRPASSSRHGPFPAPSPGRCCCSPAVLLAVLLLLLLAVAV